jgi:alanine racemase
LRYNRVIEHQLTLFMPTTTATINLAAIRHNLQQVRRLAPHSRIMAAVKADAYGHGLVEVASALDQADGLAVARLEEALQLRAAGLSQPILLLCGPLDSDSLQSCAAHGIDIAIHDWHCVQLLLATELSQTVNCWLKHDSGMHRLGLNDQQLQQAAIQLKEAKQVGKLLLMTHFSSSEQNDPQVTEQQTHLFMQATANLKLPRSLANSAAIMQYPASHQDWVRPGIMLYGANPLPSPQVSARPPIDLQAVMTLSTQVVAIRKINKGESVGYNRRWTATEDSLIATLAVGYGDGYPRHAGNGTPVLINGQRAALVGTVSMDLITVDISKLEPVNIGDRAILWGDGLPVEEIADCAATISYQLCTGVSRRVPRLYINPGH